MVVGFGTALQFIVRAVLFLNILQQSETFNITSSPARETIVVEGVNSSRVSLVWKYSLAINETIRTITFFRRISSSERDVRIATKRESEQFSYNSEEFKARYEALSSSQAKSATLVLLDVKNSEEYRYTLRISTNQGNQRHRTSLVVYVPPNITLNTLSNAEVEIGQELTLSCNASGDPLPNITWTKDGVPQSEFAFSGYELHLADVQRMDIGSYRCTAYNGYGGSVSKASIVGLHCSQCRSERVNITLTSELWNETLMNRESNEFRTLENNILSSIMKVYITNDGKLLYGVMLERFSPGSVIVTVRMLFGTPACDPLNPLRDEIASARLGQFTVDPQLYIYPPVLIPTTRPTARTNLVTTRRPKTKGPGRKHTDSDSKETLLMFHAIYLAVICFLVMVNIILAFLLWRRYKNKGSATEKCCELNESYNKRDDAKGREETLQESRADVLSHSTDVLSLHSLPVSEMSLDTTPQSIYDACKPTPARRSWEFSREHVNLIKEIGKGAFCQVAKAEAWNISGIKGLTTVAVKMLKENASDSDRKDLLSELELLKNLKPHPHVINLMGCVTNSDPLLVLIEYIPYGDLLGFLRKSRGLNDTYYKDPDVKPRTNLTSQKMMQFAWQIADGMRYLSSNKIIHRDLAARNVLVGEGEKCKVTDFGMARNVEQGDIYTKRSRGRLPVKWTAHEALLYGTYTTQSDVWSFGVVLYEIFTVGGCPYPGISGYQIANLLKKGYRMPKPKHVDQNLYNIMLQCWQQKPNDRPTFSMLKNKLSTMIQNDEEIYINMQEYNTDDYGYIDDLLE
ncbi:tyrosine kinase receptor Cad96Ca-like [Montipora foliosa]|uniref:tyrosine kinase receptor Cad96Ca-like n=1 Tax=Montipora foliosa TaxID=591990 RepID=UPI0035F149C9